MSSHEFNNESLSSEDKIAIFSLLLYYSCVLRISQFFQDCSKSLNVDDQKIVFTFFEIIKEAQEINDPITIDVVSRAVQKAAPSTPRYRIFSSSPLKTPDKNVASSTPSKLIPHEKLMELKFTRTQLENERYEKNLLESEVKDYEGKIIRLRKLKKYVCCLHH